MNVFHITYEPNYKILDIHFWGCNLKCRGCYKNYDTFDLGLSGHSVEGLLSLVPAAPPSIFLTMDEVLSKINNLKPKYTIFMGQEAALDPELPGLAQALHDTTHSHNILLTNGLVIPDLSHIDEVVFSFKAYNDKVHIEYTGRSNFQIMINFRELLRTGIKTQAEIAYIPGLVEEDEIEALAKYIGTIDPELSFRVTQYFRVPGAPWRAADQTQVERAAARAKLHLKNVVSVTSDMKETTWKPERIF